MFKETKSTSTKKFEEKVRKDPIRSKRPDLPMTGPGMNSRPNSYCNADKKKQTFYNISVHSCCNKTYLFR